MTERRYHPVPHPALRKALDTQRRASANLAVCSLFKKSEHNEKTTLTKKTAYFPEACAKLSRSRCSVLTTFNWLRELTRTIDKMKSLLYMREIRGNSGSAAQPNFFTQDKLPNDFSEELSQIGTQNEKTPSEKEVLHWIQPPQIKTRSLRHTRQSYGDES